MEVRMKDNNITNAENVKEMLTQVLTLFEDLDTIKKNIENAIYNEELKQEDYLHELELAKLNGIEIMKVAKDLRNVRQERRLQKNKLELLKTVKCFVDKYISKGIISEIKQTIENINKLIDNQNNRHYSPRVIKNLKCAKYSKEEEEKDILLQKCDKKE